MMDFTNIIYGTIGETAGKVINNDNFASNLVKLQIKYPNIARLVTIREVGYNDAQDSNISLEELPEEMKSSQEYLEGYKKGLEEIQKKYKHK